MSSRSWPRTFAGSRPSFATTSSTSPLACSNSIATSSGDELMERSYAEPRRRRKNRRARGSMSIRIRALSGAGPRPDLRENLALLVDHFQPLQGEGVGGDAHVALAGSSKLADLAV